MEWNGADVDEGAELGSIEMDTSMVFVFPRSRWERAEGNGLFLEVVLVVGREETTVTRVNTNRLDKQQEIEAKQQCNQTMTVNT